MGVIHTYRGQLSDDECEDNFLVMNGPGQMDLAAAFFRSWGDLSRKVPFYVKNDQLEHYTRLQFREEAPAVVLVTGLHHDFVGFAGEDPDIYVDGILLSFKGQDLNRESRKNVQFFYRQKDRSGRFRILK